MYGFRWKDNFIGVIIRGDEIDPDQEVYYERVRNIAEVLEKKDNMLVTLPTPPDHNQNPPPRTTSKASRQIDRDMEFWS
jgi:hypothetical protein